MALPKHIAPAKRLLETTTVYEPLKHHDYLIFESNVDIETRFMVDRRVMGCCWIELMSDKWYKRNDDKTISRCQIEVDVAWNNFIAHQPENEWATVAPFRMLSFDIECAGRKGIFPEPEVDPVIQIANNVKLHGSDEYVCRNVFTLNSCAPIGNAKVRTMNIL